MTEEQRQRLLPSWLWAALTGISNAAFLAALHVYHAAAPIQIVAMIAAVITFVGWETSGSASGCSGSDATGGDGA